jgi:hypothetical protein
MIAETVSSPDFAGFHLSQIETSSVDCLTLIFWGTIGLPENIQTLYLHLYHPRFIRADFACKPYFPKTLAVEFEKISHGWEIKIDFEKGNMQYKFSGFSFSVLHTEAKK